MKKSPAARRQTEPEKINAVPPAALARSLLQPTATAVVIVGPVVVTAQQHEPPRVGLPIMPHGFVTETGFLLS